MTSTETTARKITYRVVPQAPDNLIWITPRQHQGQIVEVEYSTGRPAGRGGNYDAAHGDLWRRTTDHSTGEVTYARRVGR